MLHYQRLVRRTGQLPSPVMPPALRAKPEHAPAGPGSVVAGTARALGASLLGDSLLFHAHAHVALLAHLS